MKWETYPAIRTADAAILEQGPVRVCVEDSTRTPGKQWMHMCLSFGEFSRESHESCKETWPHRAIELAREALDEWENEIGGTM